MSFSFAIEQGGTFTDVYAEVPDAVRPTRILKLLTVDKTHYDSAPLEAIRRILEEVTRVPHPRGVPLPYDNIKSIRMGTTVATNALLERKGARMALLVTRGFRDLLAIGTQSRPAIFDLRAAKPETLYEAVIEVDERLVLVRNGEGGTGTTASRIVRGVTGELLAVERSPDLDALRVALTAVRATGINAVAVALLHSYVWPDHERVVGALASELGFSHVSLSSDVMPMAKIVPRGFTSAADAYLTPHILAYIARFRSGFVDGLSGPGAPSLLFMQSDGGLASAAAFSGHRAVLSGPAAGVVGVAATAWAAGGRPVIAIDMGGTSSDVSRFAGTFEHVSEATIAGVTLQAPQLDISTVAAGGGSRLFHRPGGLLAVGPESAGAHPGPVCYRKPGGVLALTDANVQLSRVVPELFPHIFGPGEDEPLDVDGARRAFESLAADVNTERAEAAAAAGAAAPPTLSADELAVGFVRIANEAMCRPIRALTQMRGHDLRAHTLAVFGGAGPQHACALARILGITRVAIARHASILSAYGLALADVVAEAQAPVAEELTPASSTTSSAAIADAVVDTLATRLRECARAVAAKLEAQGASTAETTVELFLNVRFGGTDTPLMTPARPLPAPVSAESNAAASALPLAALLDDSTGRAFAAAAVRAVPSCFRDTYRREFGFVLPGRETIVDDVRVRAVARGRPVARERVPDAPPAAAGNAPPAVAVQSVYWEGIGGASGARVSTPVYRIPDLLFGHVVAGPALLVDAVTTVVVEPGFAATLGRYGDLELEQVMDRCPPTVVERPTQNQVGIPTVQSPPSQSSGASTAAVAAVDAVDPVLLAVFGHRFMSIAEEMGRALQRTSVSVNIRERLDFSCALFGPDGGLVANAPHIPVHLGAVQRAVQYQMAHWGSDLRDGDVLVSNHPQLAGGSHLPDITVISPVFDASGKSIVFFVASRGHHADIGGIAPGSMPPHSKRLAEEGAAIVAFKLVREGRFDEEGITELLLAPGSNGVPGCAPCRNVRDVLSDLRAQVAANHTGIGLVRGLIDELGLPSVHGYMKHIQTASAGAVSAMLRAFSQSRGLPAIGTVTAVDFMDDGSPIALALTIDRAAGTAVFDFTGTGPEVFANTNAPPAVTASAVIYVLRCLLGTDVPLNQGVLAPVRIIIPEGSLLSPSATAAVVGGNVLTSQRVVDVVLAAFGACASSSGCMNNLTFGADASANAAGGTTGGWGYYETIAGGAGAGPGWAGTSGVHTHMTNTRITDPEVLERRYPVVLRAFHLRHGSGGQGAYSGGDGVVRELEFRAPAVVSILSERRAFRPPGAAGGGAGARGANTLILDGGRRRVALGGKNTVSVTPGDRVRIETPGGGAWGVDEAQQRVKLYDGEYSAAVAVAAAAKTSLSSADSDSTTEHSVRPLQRPTAAGGSVEQRASLMHFSGSVGRYRETQETA